MTSGINRRATQKAEQALLKLGPKANQSTTRTSIKQENPDLGIGNYPYVETNTVTQKAVDESKHAPRKTGAHRGRAQRVRGGWGERASGGKLGEGADAKNGDGEGGTQKHTENGEVGVPEGARPGEQREESGEIQQGGSRVPLPREIEIRHRVLARSWSSLV